MSFFRWGPKPSVEQQRRAAEKKIAQLSKKGHGLSPVVIEGRLIASSFWGKSWCANLERYSDYANRLPRGRSYVRHSCVIDLQIGKGQITAQVSGSSLYRISITIAPLAAKAWTGICTDCSSSIDSMVELLQGRFSKPVMDRVCRPGDGLFPSPKEIKLSCSCPDGASMCKHVAATLYGIGARLDSRPELLFLLRGVDQQDLIARAAAGPVSEALGTTRRKSTKVLAKTELAAVFGLEMDGEDAASAPADETAPRSASVKSGAAKSSASRRTRAAATKKRPRHQAKPAIKGKAKPASKSKKATSRPKSNRVAPAGFANHKATSIT